MAERSTLSAALTRRLIDHAHRLGFDLAAVTGAVQPLTCDAYRAWLTHGYHGGMAYLSRPDAVARRSEPGLVLPCIGSLLAVGTSYFCGVLPARLRHDRSRGLIAAYAWRADYHLSLASHLHELAELITDEAGRPVASRAFVDTGPVLERDLARRAGLGFIGKNTNLINPLLGSWLLLGEVLVGAQLSSMGPARPGEAGTCGACTRCLEACPTGALVAPYVLDARRCISYLTIENKGRIPREYRALLGSRIFGCDVCQEVCPWNRRPARAAVQQGSLPPDDAMAPSLLDLMTLDEAGFRQRFRDRPVQRAKRRGLLRNVAVALGNWGEPAAVPALGRALEDAEPLVRAHAAWALGRIAAPDARNALGRALAVETNAAVQEEIRAALG